MDRQLREQRDLDPALILKEIRAGIRNENRVKLAAKLGHPIAKLCYEEGNEREFYLLKKVGEILDLNDYTLLGIRMYKAELGKLIELCKEFSWGYMFSCNSLTNILNKYAAGKKGLPIYENNYYQRDEIISELSPLEFAKFVSCFGNIKLNKTNHC